MFCQNVVAFHVYEFLQSQTRRYLHSLCYSRRVSNPCMSHGDVEVYSRLLILRNGTCSLYKYRGMVPQSWCVRSVKLILVICPHPSPWKASLHPSAFWPLLLPWLAIPYSRTCGSMGTTSPFWLPVTLLYQTILFFFAKRSVQQRWWFKYMHTNASE